MDAHPASFTPRFCPWPECAQHLRQRGFRYSRAGTYTRDCEPRTIPRFRCGHCRRRFSSQTFSTTYYLKRPELQPAVFHRLLTCSGYRQMAREARCAATTIMGQVARLGRHALLALHAWRPRGSIHEPLVIDGFESFAYSQYHPLHLNLAVGARSHYVYAFTHTELRRKGSMREVQKRRREWLEETYGRPDPKALRRDVAEVVRLAAPEPTDLVIRSDEHKTYPLAWKDLPTYSIRHECTPSKAARTPRNPLFAVNNTDLLLRHNSANHKRETIAFSKRHQGVVERAAVLLLWKNFMKPFSENHGGGTPAMRLGVRERPLDLAEVLKERLFPHRVGLPEVWAGYYRRKVPTARIKNPREHRLARAF